MKLGINNSIWEIKGICIEEALVRIKSYGFKYVDILAVGSANPKLLNAKDKIKIINSFKKLNLISSSMVTIPPNNIATSDAEEKKNCFSYLKACADFQLDLGGKQILIGNGCGSKINNKSFEETWINSINFLKNVCEYLYDLDMLLTLELEPTVFYMCNNTYRMLKMIEDVNAPNLFLNIDIGHLAITRESPKELRKLKNLIIHAHISDNNGKEHANWIIGSGVTPIKKYFEEFTSLDIDEVCKQYGETMVAALEIGIIGENIDDPDHYVSKSLDFMDKNIPEVTI